ncbi:hypothetical protein H1235_08640 [Pseudoxanthomonas sp. NC8]|nr:hypothetical protein H1235_08640 [Pseudoxanthomonas sp. NC8]
MLCLTLPIVVFVTGRNEPAPLPNRMLWWEWGLLGGYSILLAALLWALPVRGEHPLGGLLDQRFMLAALMIWAVLRLPLALVGATDRRGDAAAGLPYRRRHPYRPAQRCPAPAADRFRDEPAAAADGAGPGGGARQPPRARAAGRGNAARRPVRRAQHQRAAP